MMKMTGRSNREAVQVSPAVMRDHGQCVPLHLTTTRCFATLMFGGQAEASSRGQRLLDTH